MTTLTSGLERTRRAREHFEKLIQNPELLGPDFQPVRRLADGAVAAWQAVGRGNVGPELSDRETFARTASALGLAERVDWTFRCRVFDVAADHHLNEPLHLKPAFVSYGTVPPPRLAVSFGRARSLDVVAEVHQDAFDHPARLAVGLEEFSRWGWSLAVGDLSERTDAATILQKLRPSIAHVDLTRAGRSEDDGVRRYADTVHRLGVALLATGLDSPLRTAEAENLGATFGRGTALGVPGDLPG